MKWDPVVDNAKVERLLRRATAGRRPNPTTMLKPSLIYRLEKDPWGVYQDYHGPTQEKVDETTRYERLRMESGVKFENEWVQKNYPDAVVIEGYNQEALRRTLDAMCRGVRAIHHPQLWSLGSEIYGQGDLLVREEGVGVESNLGPYFYRVKECKKAAHVQPYHKLQGAIYNQILGKLQGYAPPTFDVVLPSGEERVDVEHVEQDLKDLIEVWRDLRDGTERPDLPGYDEALSPWRIHANKILTTRNDITLVAGCTARVRRKFEDEFGVTNIQGLRRLTLKDFERVYDGDSATRRYWQSRAYVENRPILYPGSMLEIPRRRRTIFWDFETSDSVCPLGEPPHAYLIGTLEDGQYRSFLARAAREEEKMFREFLAYLGNTEDVHLVQWTRFEEGVLRRAAERNPVLADRLAQVATACVDLYELVKAAMALPVSSYSIKQVAPVFGFNWRQQGVDGLESMVLYWEWLVDGDQRKIDKVLTYNEDDVRAMQAVEEALRGPFLRRG